MRPLARLVPLAVLAGAIACASASVPPGGPESFDPPKILRVRPDTNAINVRAGGITFDFDKVVSERPQGSSNLGGLFIISPSYGEPSVSWRRKTISVSPRGGLRANTTYHIRMLPGLTDLEGNVDSAGRELVFATGQIIATGHVRGIVFDWQNEKPGALALVEAFPIPTSRDSLRYLTIADSMGRFDLTNLPAGNYLLRGFIDQNKNRLLDQRELYDTMRVALVDSVRHEILAYVHDTIGVGIRTVTVVDSLTLRVALDRALDTTFVVDATPFSLKSKDSTLVPIARVLSRRAYDEANEASRRTKAIQDSIQRAARSDSARGDSGKAVAADTAKKPAPPTNRRALPTRRAAIDSAVARNTERDSTTQEKPPKPSKPAPVDEVVIVLDTPLAPATPYRLRARDLRSLLQRSRTSERVFVTAKAKPAADTTDKGKGRPGRDSTKVTRDTSRAAGVPARLPRDTVEMALRTLFR